MDVGSAVNFPMQQRRRVLQAESLIVFGWKLQREVSRSTHGLQPDFKRKRFRFSPVMEGNVKKRRREVIGILWRVVRMCFKTSESTCCSLLNRRRKLQSALSTLSTSQKPVNVQTLPSGDNRFSTNKSTKTTFRIFS